MEYIDVPVHVKAIVVASWCVVIACLLYLMSIVTHPVAVEAYPSTTMPVPIETCLPQPTHLVPQ